MLAQRAESTASRKAPYGDAPSVDKLQATRINVRGVADGLRAMRAAIEAGDAAPIDG